MPGTIVVCGYGPGISDAVARRFGREGFAVAIVARTEEKLSKARAALEEQKIHARAFQCDVSDPDAVRSMLTKVRAALGPIEVVHWNALAGRAGDLVIASTAEVRTVFDVSVHGLVAALQEALPDLEQSRGAVLVTGGGLSRNGAGVDSLAVKWNVMGLALAKAAQHKLVGLLHEKLAPKGVYVGEVTVLGIVKGSAFDPGTATLTADTVAEAFLALYQGRKEAYVDVA
jgi:NAD(P)-dependent dehydrogenase (short-subunit alcohol dehydrogenase family)